MKRSELWPLPLVILLAWGLGQWLAGRAHADEAEALRSTARAGDIVMLSTNDCIYCHRAAAWLDAERIPWRECNVDIEAACLRAFQARGGRGTPTFVVRGKTVVGFDPAGLVEALKG